MSTLANATFASISRSRMHETMQEDYRVALGLYPGHKIRYISRYYQKSNINFKVAYIINKRRVSRPCWPKFAVLID